MTYPIFNMAQLAYAVQFNGEHSPRFVRSSRLPRVTDGPDVVAVITDGENRAVARWERNNRTGKLECNWIGNHPQIETEDFKTTKSSAKKHVRKQRS